VTDAIKAAINALFSDPNIASDAVYRAQGTGNPQMVRLVTRRPDEVLDFGDAQVVTATTFAELRVSELPDPQAGDTLEIGGELFTIQGTPRRDTERLIWSLDLRPE
jgi:hypothetical protein